MGIIRWILGDVILFVFFLFFFFKNIVRFSFRSGWGGLLGMNFLVA